ncbi:short chain enoyl-CoA hydratase [Desulforamulus reducens MI-1]|uniref:short-chain-enoyl-CoA hydratase n=1 Tax=Desulforamulus reducens (strain ATCC BAA-1160 / DSM 100696 / MI-1) TaxID=349161 RepID=A4J4L9_DESRM|nr:enoyl-CoA hydratase-related protein [Desulforamulus reducens]ABO50022.1 short chain enoyl-CoA hydratase [Desulforamulus reducens MI-1]
MDYKNLLYSKEENIAIITLNRPKVLNALNQEIISELHNLFDQLAGDEEVKVVILTGGEKVFAAGADIPFMLGLTPKQAEELATSFHAAFDRIESLNKPVIAAIAGFALGGGCELSMACDLRIATEDAKFGQPEINLGVIPGAGGTQRLSRLVGVSRSKELIYTGKIIDAPTALSYGLINEIVKAEDLLAKAKKLAKGLASKPPVALGAAKRAINYGVEVDKNTGNCFERQCFALLFSTQDQKEGMNAFLEKRKAEFKGN